MINVMGTDLSMKLNRFLHTLLALLLAGAALTAQALPPQDKQALQTALQDFVGYMQKGNTNAAIKASIPPALSHILADKMGLSVEDVYQFSQQQAATQWQKAQLESFHYDMENAREGMSSKGKPYVLIPYTTTVKMHGKSHVGNSHILALKDQGTWYLIRLNNPAQLQLVQEAYPDLADLTLP